MIFWSLSQFHIYLDLLCLGDSRCFQPGRGLLRDCEIFVKVSLRALPSDTALVRSDAVQITILPPDTGIAPPAPGRLG